MGLSLTVLGCCGSYPGPGQATSGYLVRGDGTAVWIDAGSGTMARLQQHVGLDEVDAVVLTHEHPDHWTDINGFHVACKYFLGRDGVPVYAPAGVAEAVYHAEPPLDWRLVGDADRATVGGLSLSFHRTDHPVETVAVRVDGGGRSLGYSADTGPGWSVTELGTGLDLLLCEATFLDEGEPGGEYHLTASQAGAQAREAGARQLVITHLPPGADGEAYRARAAAAYGAPVDLAHEHAHYEI